MICIPCGSFTGAIQMQDPYVQVQKVDVAERQADLQFSVSLNNRDQRTRQCGIVAVKYEVNDATNSRNAEFQLFQRFVLAPGATSVSVAFGTEHVLDAQLWYPHTHGTPTLYNATFAVVVDPCETTNTTGSSVQESENLAAVFNELLPGALNDEADFQFGIRKVEPIVNSALGGLEFLVNDERVFLNGGNWIASDQLMRFAADYDRALAEVAFHR